MCLHSQKRLYPFESKCQKTQVSHKQHITFKNFPVTYGEGGRAEKRQKAFKMKRFMSFFIFWKINKTGSEAGEKEFEFVKT